MFRFEDPQYLYLLAVVVLLAVVRFFTMRGKRKKLRKFGDPELVKLLSPNVSRWRPEIKFWLLEAALALLIVVIARPQMGTRISHEKRDGIETVIAIDISNSMRAEDVAPSRLDRAKMMVENLVDNFSNDKIGLIVFAGDAFVQLPITSDFVSAKMFLSSIDPSMIATQGTDIGRAVSMAANSFTQTEGIGKAIIVITDGEDHEGGALEAAEAAKKKGMGVYVLGIGSKNGSPIPDPSTGNYMIDNTGNTVMSTLNEDMCRQVAQAGGGAYIHVDNNSNAQEQLNNELEKLSKKETMSTVYSDYDEQFQAFCIIAILLLIIEVCMLEIKNPVVSRFTFFGKKKAAMLTLFIICASAASAQSDRQYIREGNKAFRAGSYDKAEVAYRKALEKNPKSAIASYNLGNALFAQKKDSAAVQSLENAAKMETIPMRRAQAFHNMGVICQSHKMYGDAINAYQSALRLNPNDDETRYNLELCKQQKKKQDQQKKQDKQNKDQGKDKKKQDKQNQDKNNKDQDKQKQQQQKPQMSKDNAEQLLNAAIQQEKNTQQRMKKAQQQGARKLQKNW